MDSIGSRGWKPINYSSTCNISGVNNKLSLHTFELDYPHIIVRVDLVNYCYEYLSYKFGVTGDIKDLALCWSKDEWWYHQNKVYRDDLLEDYKTTKQVIERFKNTFDKANCSY